MFLVNSRYPLVTATPKRSGREVLHTQGHTFSRSYGANLPSSLTRVLSSALVFSTCPPESVCGTVTLFQYSTRLFLEVWDRSLQSEDLRHHLSTLCARFIPTLTVYRLVPKSNNRMTYPAPSPLCSTMMVQEYSPDSHRLRLSATP